MTKRITEKPTRTIHVELTPELQKTLRLMAIRRDTTVSHIVAEAIKVFDRYSRRSCDTGAGGGDRRAGDLDTACRGLSASARGR